MKWMILIVLMLPGLSLSAQSAVQNVRGMEDFRKWFQENNGKVRIITLLSPT